jgi:hypothetical protein
MLVQVPLTLCAHAGTGSMILCAHAGTGSMTLCAHAGTGSMTLCAHAGTGSMTLCAHAGTGSMALCVWYRFHGTVYCIGSTYLQKVASSRRKIANVASPFIRDGTVRHFVSFANSSYDWREFTADCLDPLLIESRSNTAQESHGEQEQAQSIHYC